MRKGLLPTITVCPAISDAERKLIVFPVRLGGMGIALPVEAALIKSV